MGVYIIAEAGVNHNGCVDLALELCRVAKECKVDAVKFQTWKTENIVTDGAHLAEYQEKNIGEKNESQFEMLKKLELSYKDFEVIKKYCDSIGIQFLSTPDDEESLDFLSTLGLPFIKVGSGEVTNIPYLRKIGKKKLPIVLSTGMSGIGDVERAYYTLIDAGAPEITLLHCTTNYPCPVNEVNLSAMRTLRDAFKCEVGYSDHTEGIEIPVAAVALGASIIEKHFTLDKSMDGPDHQASVSPKELENMVIAIRKVERALGDGIKRPTINEQKISTVVQKRIVAKDSIKKGEFFSEKNLTVKRSDQGLIASCWDLIMGGKAQKDYCSDEPILFI